MVSKNGANTSELSVKLNQLEDKVTKLTAQIKANKQTISELQLVIAQRDNQLHELELQLGYAQKSLIEKAVHKIEECRVQIQTGLDEKVINPTVTQIQQHVKTAQEFVDEAKDVLRAKKALVDNTILMAKDKAVKCPEQAKQYVEKSLIEPAQALLNQTLESINEQVKTTRSLIEDKAIYPGKVIYEEIVHTTQNLPDKALALLDTQVIGPVSQANKKASNFTKAIYPETLSYLDKTTSRMRDIFNQALLEIKWQIKKSPFWDGKNKLKVTH